MKKWLFFIWAITCTQLAVSQEDLLFNATDFDFGTVGQTEVPFEHDFIFRNTGFVPVTVLSARSIDENLKFIHTKSDVFTGEYGFVKVKLYTNDFTGTLNDEIYVTFKAGEEIKSTVLYVRAKVSSIGEKDNGRAFQDTKIATSVEVTPEDIENMEGFFGQDKLTQMESELKYLRKQVSLKSDLIAQLSQDLHARKAQEEENIAQLKQLKASISNANSVNREAALAQINELSRKLTKIQEADEKMRNEIERQELKYLAAIKEADSARLYAQELSKKLQLQFQTEAKAIEKAQLLEANLAEKQKTEAQQQAQIDSLTRLVSNAQQDNSLSLELARLKEELDWKQKEQELQAKEAERQVLKISELKAQKSLIEQYSDSLSKTIQTQENENESLNKKLLRTTYRISTYEQKLDSLVNANELISSRKVYEQKAIDSLNNALNLLAKNDQELKSTIQEKDKELASLLQEKKETENTLRVLEDATSRQLQQANDLLNRINSLSQKESEARRESIKLQNQLATSKAREDSTRAFVNTLITQVASKESNLKIIESQLTTKELQLNELKEKEKALNFNLARITSEQNTSKIQIDSLQQLAKEASTNQQALKSDIRRLQEEIIHSHNEESELKAYASELESKLNNAKLSNTLTFEELKSEAASISKERNRYRKELSEAEKTIEALRLKLDQTETRARNAEAFAKEIGYQKNVEPIEYELIVLQSKKQLKSTESLHEFGDVTESFRNGNYCYSIKHLLDYHEAIRLKDKTKARGYTLAYIVAYKDGKLVSLKEAQDTALK